MKPLSRNKYLSLGSKRESCVLPALKCISVIDSDSHLERGPIEFILVKSITNPWLASSIDGVVAFQVDSRLKEILI